MENEGATAESETTIDRESPLVVAVVLTWNDSELTTRCLQSVFDSDYPNLKVVLVDNGSVPKRGPELAALFPAADLVQLEENQGFSGGANRGIERALGLNPTYVHLIGNDATLASHTISVLVRECEARPTVGAAGPLILDPGEEDTVQFYTASLDRDLAFHRHHFVGEPYSRGDWPTTETEFIPCVALFFRAEALRDVGLFDERFGTCWEDFDLCLRLRDANWKYIAVGDATVTHLGSYTTGTVSPYITYYTTRNRLICLKRYSRDLHRPRRILSILRSFSWQIRRYGLLNWRCHGAFARGVIDSFFTGSHGEALRTPPGRIPGIKD